MALIRCPECRKDVSDSAGVCPHCGYKIEKAAIKNFVPVKTDLVSSKPTSSEIIKAVICFVLGIPTLLWGILTMAAGYGFIMLALGLIVTIMGVLILRTFQDGVCPYCGGKLRLNRGNAVNHGRYTVKCGHCHNVMLKTKTQLITTHSADTRETLKSNLTVETSFSVAPKSASVRDFSKYHQRWDESYDKHLGYERFKICTEIKEYPFDTTLRNRLSSLRTVSGYTQKDAASYMGISPATLSSYENGLTVPPESLFPAIARTYNVPVDYLKMGYTLPLDEQIRCARKCDEEFIDNLCFAVSEASHMFPELLTDEDKELCRHLNDYLNLNIDDLFDEKARAKEKARQEAKAEKERLTAEIKKSLFDDLESGEVVQSDFVKQHSDHENLTRKIIDELVAEGKITKEKRGASYVLTISDSQDNEDVNA